MIVSLSVLLVLCFKGNLFIVVYILVTLRIWALWSDSHLLWDIWRIYLFCC